MTDDLIRAEANAVRAVRRGVERYAETIRDAMRSARRDVTAADLKAQEAVERRRSNVQRREQELRRAEVALRQCPENCEALRQQVTAAARRLVEVKQSLDRAREAAQLISTAQTELLMTMHNAESVVGQHSSIASSALASLDMKLAELPKFGAAQSVRNVVATTAVGVEIVAATMNFGRAAGDALQAAHVNTSFHDQSMSQMTERIRDQELDYVAKQEIEARHRMASLGVEESELDP